MSENELESSGTLTGTVVLGYLLRDAGLDNVSFMQSLSLGSGMVALLPSSAPARSHSHPPSPLALPPPPFPLLLLLHLLSLLFLIEIGLFYITLLSLFYLAFNCHDNICLGSSPN